MRVSSLLLPHVLLHIPLRSNTPLLHFQVVISIRIQRLLTHHTLPFLGRIRSYLRIIARLTRLLLRTNRRHHTMLINTVNRVINAHLHLIRGHAHALPHLINSILLTSRSLHLLINLIRHINNATLHQHSSNIHLHLHKFRTPLNLTRRHKHTLRLRQRRPLRLIRLANRLLTIRARRTKHRRTNLHNLRHHLRQISSIVSNNRLLTKLRLLKIRINLQVRHLTRVKRLASQRHQLKLLHMVKCIQLILIHHDNNQLQLIQRFIPRTNEYHTFQHVIRPHHNHVHSTMNINQLHNQLNTNHKVRNNTTIITIASISSTVIH